MLKKVNLRYDYYLFLSISIYEAIQLFVEHFLEKIEAFKSDTTQYKNIKSYSWLLMSLYHSTSKAGLTASKEIASFRFIH